MNKTTKNIIIKNVFIWWTGWFSLGLVEMGFRLTLGTPLILMISLTLFIYYLIGIVSGVVYATIAFLIQRSLRRQHSDSGITQCSMSFCMCLIILLYILFYFLKVTLPQLSLLSIFKSGLLFTGSIALFFFLYFFFWWMERKGKLFISYFSILPSTWIITSLIMNKFKKAFPPALQITTFSRAILLILGSMLCFFIFYSLFSTGKRYLPKWKEIPFLKPALLGLPFIFIILLSVLFLRRENQQHIKYENQNPPQGKPNVILITLDTTRSDHLSCYGYERLTTPNLDKFSQEGVLFKKAYSNAAWTLPSHASIFTGLYPIKHGAHNKSEVVFSYFYKSQAGGELSDEEAFHKSFGLLSEENNTLAKILSGNGYKTAGFIGGVLCSSMWGFAQGFEYYNERFPSIISDIKLFLIYQVVSLCAPLIDISSQYGYNSKRLATDINKSAFEWLEKNHTYPFFLFFNYFDAHSPYVPPPSYDGYFSNADKGIIVKKYNSPGDLNYVSTEGHLFNAVLFQGYSLTPQERQLIVSQYDREIRYLDHCLGLLFEKLKTLKVYDNTMIIITSDHGEAFGEHIGMGHGKTLYEEILHVPLIIKYPITSPRRGVVEKQVSLVDLFPTILSLTHCPIPVEIDGKNLDDPEHPIIAEVYASWELCTGGSKKYLRDLKSFIKGKYKYIWSSNSLHELYDLERDPGEKDNLISKFPQIAKAMHRELEQILPPFKSFQKEQKELEIDKTTIEKLRALGYVR